MSSSFNFKIDVTILIAINLWMKFSSFAAWICSGEREKSQPWCVSRTGWAGSRAAGLGKKLFACVHIPLGVGGRSHRLLVFTPHGLRATKTNFSSRRRIKFAAAGRRAELQHTGRTYEGMGRTENVTALRVLAVCRGRRNESVGGEPSERTLVQDKRWPVIIAEQRRF